MSESSVEQSNEVAQTVDEKRQPSFDSLVKYLAAFSLLLYCCGYFVVSVSSLSWGFYQIAPFRPKIASAGAWFILFLGVPLAAITFRRQSNERAESAASFLFYAIWGVGLGFGTFPLFESTSLPPLHAMLNPMLLVFVFLIIGTIPEKRKAAKWVVSIASVLYVAGSGFYDLFKYRLVTVSAILLWYLVVGFLFNFALNMFKGRNLLENLTRGVPYLVSQLLLALSYFGHVYYPHIKASWGGGAPVSVTILFAKESPILPGQYLSTQL